MKKRKNIARVAKIDHMARPGVGQSHKLSREKAGESEKERKRECSKEKKKWF